MPFILRPRGRRSPDETAAEGLLAGRGVLRGAPADLHAIARLFEAATAPATERELSGEAAAVAVAALVLGRRMADSLDGRPGRRPRGRRFAGAPALAAGVITAAVVAVGGTAAADALPAPIQELAHIAFGAPVPHHPAPRRPGTRYPAHGAHRVPGSAVRPGRHGTRPDAAAKAHRKAAGPKSQQADKAKGHQKTAGSRPTERGNRPANAAASRRASRE